MPPSKQFEILTYIVDAGPVNAVEIQPLLPPQSGEKQPDDPMRYFLDALLEFIVSQVSTNKQRLCLSRSNYISLYL